MRHALNQETQPGTLIPHPELESQLMLRLHHIQIMPSMFNWMYHQLLIPVLIQTKQLRLMNHALSQETLPGTLTLLPELESQLMLKHHHTQDMLSIFRLTQQLTLALTQIKLLRLMNHAPNQETLHGTLTLLLELESQLMHKHHHIQDMLFIYK